MSIQFSKPLMNAATFPVAKTKVQPSLNFHLSILCPTVKERADVTLFSKARYALAAAALHLKLSNQKNTVLMPAYHCPALVEPFIAQGYNIEFYPQLSDLSTDLESFKQLLTDEINHVVIVRFFGFNQNAEELIQAAFEAKKIVIEDCAHSLQQFLDTCEKMNESIAASVSSIGKTLGTADGGLLYLPNVKVSSKKPASLQEEVKCLLSGQRIVALSKLETDFRYYNSSMQEADCLRLSKWIFYRSDYVAIKKKRRENYEYLANHLEHSKLGSALYPKLTQDDAPYVMPFLLNNISTFSSLREGGVQVQRWEEFANVDLGINLTYRGLLVQLPCHQGLSRADLDKIISLLTQ